MGLGNPGKRYSSTRHNAGFLAVEALAQELDAHNWRTRFDSLVAEKSIVLADKGKPSLVIFAKPQTMMNRSGSAVKGLLKHYDVEPEALVVLHDDINLPAGTLRIKQGGGHGGHNGIRDIIALIGVEFSRVKIGVGSPPGRMDSAHYVLQNLRGKTFEGLKIDTVHAAEAALILLKKGLTEAQNQFN